MNAKYKKQVSKFLSYVLRHKPEKIGLELDENGWALVEDILVKSNFPLTFEELEEVVVTNDKQRFSFNEEKTKIRANQGHSLKSVDLNLKAIRPPVYLYHGTIEKVIPSIKEEGLRKMNRQHVHLSQDKETAEKVGSRRGKPILLTIWASEMEFNGYKFYKSDNGVWLTDSVPPMFIDFK